MTLRPFKAILKSAICCVLVGCRTVFSQGVGSQKLPAPVAESVQAESVSLETNLLPLQVATDFLRDRADIAIGAGGLAIVNGRAVVLDRLGKLHVYANGLVQENILPDLPMNVRDYVERARFPLDESTLRTHDLKYDEASHFLYASFEVYDKSDDSTHFEIGKILIGSIWAPSAEKWNVVFKGPPLHSVDYYSARGAGGKMVLAGSAIYVALGDYNLDRGTNIVAQNKKSLFGKTQKLDLTSHQMSAISMGHRVPQGLTLDSAGQLWMTENSARGGDKLNLIERGQNYGWPSESLGSDYGTYFPVLNRESLRKWLGMRDSITQPVYAWLPSIAPTAIIQVREFHESWDGDFLIGSLKAQSLFRVRVLKGRVLFAEQIWIGHRIRDMAAARGQIILWTDDGSLITLRPQLDLLKIGQLNVQKPYEKNNPLSICLSCHSFSVKNPFYWAPSLRGVFGRKIAGDQFANYSSALKKKQGVWDDVTLASFLLEPGAFAPGTSMPGLQLKYKDVQRVIQALKEEKTEDSQR